MAIYEKLFQRVGVGWAGGGGGGAVNFGLYTQTEVGGGRGWPFSPLWAIYENCMGGRDAVGNLNEPIRHSHARILY